MKVADVMQKHVEYVRASTPVEDVARIIFGRGINGLPVCHNRRVIGFITERDILAQFYPHLADYLKDPVKNQDFEKMEEKTSHILGLSAKDVMSKTPVTVSEHTPLLKAQSLMFTHKVARLPVVDREKNLVGIISKGDIFRSLVGQKLALEENDEYNDWLAKHFFRALDWKKRLRFEIPDLVAFLEEQQIHSVLDIGCGIGEHCLALAKEGFSVSGVERSTLMVKEAKKKRALLPHELQPKIQFFTGDYTEIFSRLKREFDAALFMGNAIAYNPYGVEEVIQKTAQRLREKSFMIFQVRNIAKTLESEKPMSMRLHKDHMFLRFYNLPEKKRGIVKRTLSMFLFDGKKWTFHGVKTLTLALLTKSSLESLLKKSGFNVIKVCGSMKDGDYLLRKPFDPKKSDWLNIIAARETLSS